MFAMPGGMLMIIIGIIGRDRTEGKMGREKVFARWQAKIQTGETVEDKDGRGKQRVEGRLLYATQLSWWLHGRGTLNERHLFHICNNPSCVNPNHLETRETIWTKNNLTPEEKKLRFELAMRKVQNYRRRHWRDC
jgi:hypothetical protein